VRPQTAARRPEKPQFVPPPPEVLQRRAEIAARLLEKVAPVSAALSAMTEEQRRAVFLKLEHDRPIDLGGTDLKAVTEPSDRFTLAVPRSETLSKLEEKIRSFGTVVTDPGKLPPNAKLGANLQDLTFGEPTDRLSQSLLEAFPDLVKEEWVIVEIEMYTDEQYPKPRRAALQAIRAEIEELFGGVARTKGNFFEHEDMRDRCRAVIRCTGEVFRELVEGSRWQRKIAWFDSKPQFEAYSETLERFAVEDLGAITGPEPGAAVVCVVDSGVTSGNPFLEPVTRRDLLRSFLVGNDNPADEHGHGSGVASLAAYYALILTAGAQNAGRVWIASARVLDEQNQGEPERLFSKVLEEVVATYVPLGVRIFNLSANIVNQRWSEEAKRTVPRRSWVARTIDRLSREHDILFIVSTGNILPYDVADFHRTTMPYPTYFCDERAKILDPAQASLALTVGSISPSEKVVGPDGKAQAIAETFHPSPFTRCGPGMAGEIKPELVDFGGNYLLDPQGGYVRTNPGVSVPVASNELSPPIEHRTGSSFAAPRVTHKAARVLADAETIVEEHVSAPLLKALVVNSAYYRGDDVPVRVRENIGGDDTKHWRNLLGYGFPDADRATFCDLHSALAIYQGEIAPDTVAYFDIPVPAVLAESDGQSRLAITVAFAPEVQRTGVERYLGTALKWKLFRGDVPRDDVIRAMSIEEEDDGGDVPRPGELSLEIGFRDRSRGTLQHSTMIWDHAEAYSVGNYTLAVASYARWSTASVPYAVVVRVEDLGGNVDVYTEVRAALAVEIET